MRRAARSAPGPDFAAVCWDSDTSGVGWVSGAGGGQGGCSAEGPVKQLGKAVPESFRVPSGPGSIRTSLSLGFGA